MKFIKTSVPTFFHIPFSPTLGKKIGHMMKDAEYVQKLVSIKENILLLFSDPHAFKSKLSVSVTGNVPNFVI